MPGLSMEKGTLWAGTALALILVLVGVIFVRYLMQSYEYAFQAHSGGAHLEESGSPLEAIVVLTGEKRRIPEAMELLRQRESEKLIISGVHGGVPLIDVVNRQEGASFRIHETWERIEMESDSLSTIENAEKSAAILKKHKLEKIILVTSDYHMPRSLKIFEDALPGYEVHAYPIRSVFSDLVFEKQFTVANLRKLATESFKYLLYTFGLYRRPEIS